MQRHRHLEELLTGFRPSDARERDYHRQMLELLQQTRERPAHAFSRDNYVPGHFTASAFVSSPRGDQLLLIHHAKIGRWLQPGGHVEDDDADLVSAARREVHEEVGIAQLELRGEGIFDLDIHSIAARGAAPAHAHYDVRFLFRAPDLHFSAGSDALAARWVALSAAGELHSDESVMRAVRKLRMGA